MDDNINSIRQFLDEFRETNVEENVKHRSSIISSFHMNPEDVKAEVLDWSMHYLEQKKCPYSLALMLAKLVAHQLSDSVYEMSLQCEEGIDDEDDSKRFRYESSQLYTEMIECLLEACTNWQDHVDINAVKIEPPPRIVSMSAIKNGRRKMEDRHVIIHDLNAVCGLKDVPQHSYYAVFDGHAGVEAASYCAAHLHWNIVNHPEFLSNTEKAIYEAVILTDRNLLERSYREGIKGGCTVLCCVIREKVMYVAWVGDSQAVLVKQGTSVPIGLPHKPDREDERCRVEELGGCILFLGTWRVNGTLAVSRALGDAEHKPYISNEPEVLKIPLDGTEDYIVLACDGLWDQLQPSDVGQVVYNHIVEGAESVDNVASKLVQLSKSQGSTDNITTIVAFLKDPHNISKSDPVFPQLQKKSEEKDSQINGTSPSDNFLNSEEIKQTVTTADPTANGVSSIEQFKNELNSLNFPQSTATLSHLQEKSLTSEVLMQQYEESCITPALLAYENPSLPNYCSTNTTLSSPQSPSNSANSSISQISDSFDLSQHIIVEKEEHNINANILDDSSIAMTSFLNFTNNHAKEDANLNQLVTINTEQNAGEDYLLGGTAHGNKPELNEEVSMPSNNFTVLEEKSEFSREAIMQTVTDMQINPAVVLPDINNDTVMQLSEGIVFRNNNEVLNSQTSESCKNEVLPNISPDNCVATVDQPNDLYEKINSVTVNNNFQTEIKVSNNDLLHSTNVENFYRQEETSNLTLKQNFNVTDDQLNLNTETDKIRNDTFHSETEDSSINLNTKKFSPHSLDLSGYEKNETVSEFPLTCDSVTGNQLNTHFIVDNVAVVNNAQTENEISTNALDKSNYLLQSPDQTDSDKLETAMEVISEKCVSIIGTEISPLDETVDTALNSNLKLENKVVGLICSPVSFQENKQLEETEVLSNNKENFSNSNIVQNFDKNQTETQLPSQNYNNFTDCKLDLYNKTDNATINDSIQLDIKTSNNNESNSFHSTQGTISDELEIAAKSSLETCANITDNGLSTHSKGSDATGDNFVPDIETCSHKPNKGDSSLIDMSDFNKYELVPELPSQVCVNNAGDTSNTYNCAELTNVPQSNNENFSSVELGNASETCTPCVLDTDVLHKVKDIDISLTEQDITESKISQNNFENTHNVPPTTESMKYTECPSKDETQPVDNLTRQPKYDQVEKIPIFESLAKQASNKTSSIQTSDLRTKGNTGHPLPHSKKLFAKPDNKTVSSKKSTVKASTTTSSVATNRQRQIPPKPAKSSSFKPVQAQQLKAKQTVTNNDVKPVCEPDVKSSVATKPKSIQPNVFERLSSSKVAFTKSREIKSRENLYSSKGVSGTSTNAVPEAKARNNTSQTSKALGATPKKFNAQSHLSENVKSKPQTSTAINNSNLNAKTPRPLSHQLTTSKAQKGNLSQKADENLLPQSKVPNVKKPCSNTEVASTKKSVSTNRQDTTKQRQPLKIAERVLVNASSRQATPFRPVTSTKLDLKRVGVVSNQQSANSKITSRAAVERSSASSTKIKEGKAAVAKSSVLQKKESNSTEKIGKKCQIQKTSATDQKKNSMPNMDGQGDCVASNKDSHLPEINGKDIELPKSDVNNSKEVPNPTLDG